MIQLLMGLIVAVAAANAWANIQIQNSDGQPVVGAEVMIGTAPNEPFEGNILTTDVNGELALPKAWTEALPMTVSAENYVRTTFPDVMPDSQSFFIHRADGEDRYEIKGDTTDYGRLRKDGKIDFSLVFPALKRSQLLQFDISSVMSPEMDQIKVITKVLSVPSNISLPKQTETYILPITIDKPTYRMYVRQPGQYRMTGLHGQFPLKRVINDIKNGKSMFEVINHFKFFGGGQLDIEVSENTTGNNINIKQMKFSSTIEVPGPTVKEGLAAIALPLVNQSGLLFPTDLKRLTSGQTQKLKVPNADFDGYVLTLLSEDRAFPGFEIEDAVNGPGTPDNLLNYLDFKVLEEGDLTPELGGLSFALQKAPVTRAPQFLELIPEPVIEERTVTFTKPALVEGVTPLATLAILSEVDKGTEQEPRAEVRTRIWEFQGEGWVDQVTLPNVGLELDPNKTHRWEVLYLGTTENKIVSNPLESVTHVTRNSVDF